MTWNFFELINKPKMQVSMLDEMVIGMWIVLAIALCGALWWGYVLWVTRSRK